eukprot:CAMPEP_0197847416 /NCGR_PEP_ID=MMETSP1438-20131217/6075_1 /TAXON_ID=1461541 /ORGANISM="Pterosperma sp., Strain CCMP1384" /LENGTH=333 /DNA_ID=CAMNT_0043459329 /DNA_START=579 /DNA_END=1581 /DNA_ORIENTATION=-
MSFLSRVAGDEVRDASELKQVQPLSFFFRLPPSAGIRGDEVRGASNMDDDDVLTLVQRSVTDIIPTPEDSVHTTQVSDLLLHEFCALASGQPVDFRGEVHQLARKFKGTKSAFPEVWSSHDGWTAGDPATLEDFLRKCPPDVGFDIEFKTQDGRFSTPEERQVLLSCTLDVLRQHGLSRPIFFSSFDPDCCIDLKAAQSQWPVLFLVYHDTEHPDNRRKSLQAAYELASEHDFAGIVCDTDLIVPEDTIDNSGTSPREVVPRILDAGLCLYTYGEHNKCKDSIAFQLESGVTAICTDDCETAISIVEEMTSANSSSCFNTTGPLPAVPVQISC